MPKHGGNQGGRPSVYTPELAIEIGSRLAANETLKQICGDDHMPAVSTVCMWIVENREGFADLYARARQAQATIYAEDLIQIADIGSGDVMRDRLSVDTRKFLLSKVWPKVFGDKVAVEHSGELPVLVVRREA
jgi:hypothetical protein